MSNSLSDLADNLSESNKKECKACMERKNIKSECDFINFKNNKFELYYMCKECGKRCFKSINGLKKTFPNMYRFCNEDVNKFVVFETKDQGEYHDLYVQCNTTLLADVFENIRDKYIEIYKLDPAHFLSSFRLAWQACLKKDSIKIRVMNR